MKHLTTLKKAIVAGLVIGIGCTVFLNQDNTIEIGRASCRERVLQVV